MTGRNVLGSGGSSNNIGIGRVNNSNNNNIENLIVNERCNNNQVSGSDTTKQSKSSRKRTSGDVAVQPDSTPTTPVRKSRRNKPILSDMILKTF